MEVSDYEAKRLQRIQQNKELLQSLGIQVQKKERVKRVLAPREAVEPRRSSRLVLQQRDASANDEMIATLLTLETIPRRVRARRTEPKPLDLPVEKVADSKRGSKRTRMSSMELEIDLATFHNQWLGKQIWPYGKNTVMQGLCPPSNITMFSRMSGAIRWKNAVVLFVNVLGQSGYDNVFTEVDNAVHFKWFAQSKQTEDSPAIVQMVNALRGDNALWLPGAAERTEIDATAPSPLVLLFIRHVDGPYIYCGRLGYLGHLPDSSPLEFRWQLMDANAVEWSKIKPLLEEPSTMPTENDIQVTTEQ